LISYIIRVEFKVQYLQVEGVILMNSKCPGQDFRNLRVCLYKCPNCGAEVEMFSDEIKIRCHKCKEVVYRDKIPSCIDWCASARQCLGEERWKDLKGADR
jgi:ribosomal protein S27AE